MTGRRDTLVPPAAARQECLAYPREIGPYTPSPRASARRQGSRRSCETPPREAPPRRARQTAPAVELGGQGARGVHALDREPPPGERVSAGPDQLAARGQGAEQAGPPGGRDEVRRGDAE